MSTGKTIKPLSQDELEHLAGRFKLLGEPMRLRILQTVCAEARSVGEIVDATGSTQANVSKHLALLAAAGVLKRERDGQRVLYEVKDPMLLELCDLVRSRMGK